MPLRLDIKRKLSSRSDRVKCVDIHPTEPWVLSSLYNGHLFLWNYDTQALVKSFEVTEMPVRAAKFVARKQWIIAGADDMNLRVYNYNTLEKIKVWEAHSDYIRCIAVHATQPYVLSSSDDMTIRLWDWDKSWQNTMTFEGHSHYVMMVCFNPKDSNTFASASLDRSIKVWGLNTLVPHFTLEGHEKGVNAIDYFAGGDRPYLVSGADDKTIKVWDYQTKQCVQTLESHTHNVSTLCCHPELPIILSGSEDGTVRIWHANTYRLENTLNYAYERCWCVCALKGTHKVAIGYDEGTIMIKLGREDPIASMDASGKIVWAKHNEVATVNVKAGEGTEDPADGERMNLATKELDVCEIYPQSLTHNANGRFAAVCGDGEYIIYTALAWRKKTFGQALDFVWALDSGEYAVRESNSTIKLYKNFRETKVFKPPFLADGLYGGALLAVRSNEVLFFFDWASQALVRRIDVCPQQVIWSDNGELVALACEESFFVLKYSKEIAAAALESGEPMPDDGVEAAFELLQEVPERIRTAKWVGDCLIYTNTNGRLNYTVGGEVITLHHLDRPAYISGYLPEKNRLYLLDREYQVLSFQLLLSVLEYQTAVVRRDFETAASVLPSIPEDQHNRIARFLEAQGFLEEALQVATDHEHKFELAVQLGKLDVAYSIVMQAESEAKWKQLGDLALSNSDLKLAEECMNRACDLSGLLLIYSSTGNGAGMDKLAELAQEKGKVNIAFICLFLRGKTEECLKLLCTTGRTPEAAFMARTYLPSKVSEMVTLWKEDLQKINPKAAESIADPLDYPNLFDNLQYALKAEQWSKERKLQDASASLYPQHIHETETDLIEHMKVLEGGGADLPAPDATMAAAPTPVAPQAEADDDLGLEAELEESLKIEGGAQLDTAGLEAELDAELEGELNDL